jgi:methenyltetrahydromethanopterin cyclohydrolase
MRKGIALLVLLLALPLVALASTLTSEVTAQEGGAGPAGPAPAANVEGSTLRVASPLTSTATYTVTDLGTDVAQHFADVGHARNKPYAIAATAVMSAVDDAVIYERHGSSDSTNLDNSHGIAVFFPSTSSSFYHPDNYDFAVGANWDDVGTMAAAGEEGWGTMLVDYIQQVNPDGPDDPEPPEPVAKLLPQSTLFLPIVIR